MLPDDVWVGFNSTILKGVNKIRSGSIIAAYCVVNKDIVPNATVVDNRAKIVKTI